MYIYMFFVSMFLVYVNKVHVFKKKLFTIMGHLWG